MARRYRQSISQILIWLAIRELEEFKLGQIQRHAQANYREVIRYIQALSKGGYVSEVREAPQDRELNPRGRGATVYRLVRDTGPKPPRHYPERDELIDPNLPDCPLSDPLDRCWQAMRIYARRFTAAQIEEVANLSHRNTLDYLRRFIRCGYVCQRQPPTKPPEYKLVRNSGPLCPVFFKGGRAFDPNDRTEYEPDQPLK